jgi:hypothetical protein
LGKGRVRVLGVNRFTLTPALSRREREDFRSVKLEYGFSITTRFTD